MEARLGLDPFPNIPPCIIPTANLKWPYSLYSLNRPIIPKPIASQMKALGRSKTQPTLGPGGSGKTVTNTTWKIMERSLEEFIGFCFLHLGMMPNLKTVMRPPAYAHFVAFQAARGLKARTMLRAAGMVSAAVPFVASGK